MFYLRRVGWLMVHYAYLHRYSTYTPCRQVWAPMQGQFDLGSGTWKLCHAVTSLAGQAVLIFPAPRYSADMLLDMFVEKLVSNPTNYLTLGTEVNDSSRSREKRLSAKFLHPGS